MIDVQCHTCGTAFRIPQCRATRTGGRKIFCSKACRRKHTETTIYAVPTQETVRALLNYDPLTGIFTWNEPRTGITSGDRAGHPANGGYILITINRKAWEAHVLAWLYVNGELVKKGIDHKNRIKSDNRIDNLRKATRAQNDANRTWPNRHGLQGVTILPNGKFKAIIRMNGKPKHLGCFRTKEAAHEAYREAHLRLHGEFSLFANP